MNPKKTFHNGAKIALITKTMLIFFQDLLKPSKNKKGQKFSSCIVFLNPFLQLAAERKDSKTVQLENFLALLIF